MTSLDGIVYPERKKALASCGRKRFMTASLATTGFSPWEPSTFSLIVYGLMVLALIAIILFLARWVGERKTSPEKAMPYECGIIPTEMGGYRPSIPFYLVAVFFVIFDVEAAFIFSWAVAMMDLGWAGWLRISFFIVLLLMTLVYVWKKGGLDWGPGTTENTGI